MSIARSAAMLPVLGLGSLLASASGEAEKPRREPGFYSVRLAEGSQVNLRLLTEEIEITTAYGKLKVPVADVRRIDVGFRYPEEVEKRVEAAVARLGDADVKVRESAEKELVRLKELAYPALRRAVHSKDPEIKRQAAALVRDLEDKLPAEQLERQEPDVIITTRFPITGRIEGPALKVHSQVFGDGRLRLADTRQVRALTVKPDAAAELLELVRAAAPRGRTMRRPDPGVYEVRLADGSLIDMRLLSKEIEILTREGKVRVPVADVRRIDIGFRYPEGVEKRVQAAVTRLGDAHFKMREAAGTELLRLREMAYPALRRAVRSNDLEIKRRATELVHKLENELPNELLRVRDEDIIVTSRSRIVGRIEGLALKVRSQVFGEGQLRLADTRQVRSLTAELVAARALLERVGEAVRARRTTRSQLMGTGKDSYEEVPKGGALLIGFDVTYGKFGNSSTVTTVRPIFLTRVGRVMGTTHGVPGEGVIRVEAKPGYAVGGVTIKAGLGVDGMSVTFMEIREGGLNPKRAYESEWLGGMGGGPKTTVAGDGAPVVGIFGATAEGTSTFNGLGLVTAAVDE
ncbi:MAG TPA: hypothetical protein VG013_34725 [Gemmataceae bacterium]|jgi:hypothetical protein|nr:hypothetical protein [Gemmataceae bacterium]